MQYVYIAVLRNFTLLDDDFFSLFCNIWIFMVASGAAFVYLFGPGKMPTQYFMCLGISPCISILLYITLSIKIMQHQRKIQCQTAPTNPNLTPVNTKSILDTIAVVVLNTVLILGNTILLVFNKMSPEQLNGGLLGSLMIYFTVFFATETFAWNLIAICY
jgi:hypothetical protein